MALVIKDRIRETTTTTGTGDVSLGGADATFDTFSSCMSNSDTTYYAIVHTTYNTDEWEVGLGTYNSSTNALARTTVLAGSNGTSPVNFSAGDKNIFITMPADKSVILDASGNANFGDNVKAQFGAGSDLQIFHDGTHTYIDETNPTGYLFIRGANTQLLNPSNDIYLECNNNGSVDIYHDNSKKLATTSTGIDVTGSLNVTDVATTQTNLDVDPAGTAVALAIALG